MSLFSISQFFKETFISPGRVKINKLKEHNVFFTNLSNAISEKQKSSYELIGHGASSWRYYPMGVNKRGLVYGNGFSNNKTPALDIVDLIKKSIEVDPKISIELDAHYAPDNHFIKQKYPNDGAYILHNLPKWDKPYMNKDSVVDYFHRNTIKNTIDFFVQNTYYQESKVYIELKSNKECIDINCHADYCSIQSEKLAKELIPYTSYVREDGQNWLCITSFSPLALKTFRDALPENLKDKFDYVLILGYTGSWVKSKLAQLKGFVPRFDSQINSFIVHSDWLNTIWFSAQGISNYKTVFNDILLKRKEFYEEEKLTFSYSTYQKKAKKMYQLMQKNKSEKLKAEIRSFMLDLDYRI